MVLKVKELSQVYNMKTFTDDGVYFGDIEECIISSNRVHGWKIKATKTSYLNKVLVGAKGVIIPHQYVKAVGDVFVINKDAVPSYEEKSEATES